MSIKSGDLVKITTKNTTHYGKTGVVAYVYEDENTCTVKLEENVNGDEFTTQGVITGFFVSELEVVKGVDEDEQIEKLATVLVHEGNFPSHASALEAARSLYRAGARIDG